MSYVQKIPIASSYCQNNASGVYATETGISSNLIAHLVHHMQS